VAVLLVSTLAVGCQALSVDDVLEVDMQRHPELYTKAATGRQLLLQHNTFDWASLVPKGGFQKVRAACTRTRCAMQASRCVIASCSFTHRQRGAHALMRPQEPSLHCPVSI
jgi:hypothetical protein